MATRVTIKAPCLDGPDHFDEQLGDAARRSLAIFCEVDRTCTRFDADSDLMRANDSPRRWHTVPAELFSAVGEAKRAYDMTGGRFDPRVLRALVALGYDRTLPFGQGDVTRPAVPSSRGPRGTARRGPWRPKFRSGTSQVVFGDEPLDLGGIGKGLAVRWASDAMASVTPNFLIDAGGDCYCAGRDSSGSPWSIGIEDPHAPDQPIATLLLRDRAATTSSIRLRRWRAGGDRVHHLIDPTTGRPGGQGLMSVTVVGRDPARAEVWSKSLFIAGSHGIAALAARRSLPALWVDEEGRLTMTAAMQEYVSWRRS